jgi:hypothetical protein
MISYVSHNVITWINTFARNDNNFNNKLTILETTLECCQGKIDKKKVVCPKSNLKMEQLLIWSQESKFKIS